MLDWPQKAPKSDIRLKNEDGTICIATGSGLKCSGWCIISGDKKPCNKREMNFLDGL